MISLKRPSEIEAMRAAGRIVAEAHALVKGLIRPGITTGELDRAVEELFVQRGAQPLFKGVPGKVPFPAVCCISLNDEVVHGIPGERVLCEGDLVKVDTGCRLDGWCGDSAWSYAVGEVSPLCRRLMEVGQKNLELAIAEMGRRRRWSEVARLMEAEVKEAGFSVVEQFVGHGIGRRMHEDPQVPNFVGRDWLRQDFEIVPGLVLAIEPMVNAGGKEVKILADHWTVATRDKAPSVHFEHTVAMTEQGPQILTNGT
ncbi:MAG: type I methionyl aminopeptidase [Planctomycetaceae bacterium]